MSAEPFVLTGTHTVHSSLCDPDMRLGIRQTAALLQDAVTTYLQHLGCDGVVLQRDYGCGWVFTRSLMRYRTRPFWNERITTRTAIVRKGAILCEIDTVATDANGEILFCSKIELCAISMQSRRPALLSFLPQLAENCLPKVLFEASFKRECVRPAGDSVAQQTVRGQDTDMNGHCNNVALMRLLLNAFSTEELVSLNPETVEITFAHECREGTLTSLYKEKNENEWQLLLTDAEGGSIVSARITPFPV